MVLTLLLASHVQHRPHFSFGSRSFCMVPTTAMAHNSLRGLTHRVVSQPSHGINMPCMAPRKHFPDPIHRAAHNNIRASFSIGSQFSHGPHVLYGSRNGQPDLFLPPARNSTTDHIADMAHRIPLSVLTVIQAPMASVPFPNR